MRLKFLSLLTLAALCVLTSAPAQNLLLYASVYDQSYETPGGILKVYDDGTNELWNIRDTQGQSLSIDEPGGIVLDVSGNVFVNNQNAIYRITSAGVATVFASVPGAYGGALGIDLAGTIYMANGSTILRYTAAGVALPSFQVTNEPDTILVGADGFIYVSDGIYGVERYSMTGEIDNTFVLNINGATGMSFDAQGNLYVNGYNDDMDRSVSKTTFSGGAVDETVDYVVFGGAYFSYGLGLDSAGNVYSALSMNDYDNVIYKVTANQTASPFSSSGDVLVFQGIAVVPEPSTYALILGGLVVLVILHRRKLRSTVNS